MAKRDLLRAKRDLLRAKRDLLIQSTFDILYLGQHPQAAAWGIEQHAVKLVENRGELAAVIVRSNPPQILKSQCPSTFTL